MRWFFLIVAALLLLDPVCVAEEMPSFYQASEQVNASIKEELCGLNNENVITEGTGYEKVMRIANKLGCSDIYYLHGTAFNAAAAVHSVFLWTGLINLTDNQLAFVIAHEMGHCRLGHIEKNYNAIKATEDALESFRKHGSEENQKIAEKVGKVVTSATLLSYSHNEEYAADAWAYDKIAEAGFDQADGLTLFNLIPGARGGSLSWLFTHPDPDKRFIRIRNESAKKRNTDSPAVRADKMNALIKELKVGDAGVEFQLKKDLGKFLNPSKGFENDLFIVLARSSNDIVAEKNVVFVPQDSEKVKIIFQNKKDSPYGMEIEVITKPDLGRPLKLKGAAGLKGIVAIFPPEFLWLSDEVMLKTKFWKDAEGKDSEVKQITLKFIR